MKLYLKQSVGESVNGVNSQTMAECLSGGMAWAMAHIWRKEAARPIEQSKERVLSRAGVDEGARLLSLDL